MRSRWSVVALLVMSATTLAPASGAPAAVLAARTITADETITDAIVLVAGTTTVNASATLTIERASMIGSAGARIVVNAGATLRLIDVSAEFVSLDVRGSASLTRASLARSSGDLVNVDGGSVNATALSLYDAGGTALRATGSTIVVSSLAVSGAIGRGISIDGGSFDGSGVSVAAAYDYGMIASAATVNITGSTFFGHCGLYLDDASAGSVSDSTFSTDDHGLTLIDAGAVAIDDVRFTSGYAGLTSVASTLDVEGITATGVERGVVSFSSGGTIDDGTIAADVAVEVSAFGAAVPMLRNLDLSGSTTGVTNASASTVDARWNWWGGTPGAGGNPGASGSVTISPWLAAAPA